MKKPFEIVFKFAGSRARDAEVIWAKTKAEAVGLFGVATGQIILTVREA